jgi:hypothetical protein
MGRKKGSKNIFPKADCLGLSKTRLYKIWADIKTRCFNENSEYYRDYGGRGIAMCAEWLDFLVFYEWALKNGYQDDLEIDRIDVNGNYEPANCRFVTEKEQTINRRVTRFYTIGNKTLCLNDWCDIYKMKFNTVSERLERGWDIKKALGIKAVRLANSYYTSSGITCSLKNWCIACEIKWPTFLNRIRLGWSIEDALNTPVKKS